MLPTHFLIEHIFHLLFKHLTPFKTTIVPLVLYLLESPLSVVIPSILAPVPLAAISVPFPICSANLKATVIDAYVKKALNQNAMTQSLFDSIVLDLRNSL